MGEGESEEQDVDADVFISLMATVMSLVVLNSTAEMQEIAQAEILGNEALNNLREKIRFGTNVTLSAEGDSASYKQNGGDYKLHLEEGKIFIISTVKGETSTAELFAGVSYGNLTVSALQFALDDGAMQISVTVAYGAKDIWNGKISVRPLNGVAVVA